MSNVIKQGNVSFGISLMLWSMVFCYAVNHFILKRQCGHGEFKLTSSSLMIFILKLIKLNINLPKKIYNFSIYIFQDKTGIGRKSPDKFWERGREKEIVLVPGLKSLPGSLQSIKKLQQCIFKQSQLERFRYRLIREHHSHEGKPSNRTRGHH